MKHVRPLPEKDFVETMASWPIVRWTVPRLGVAYAWALPFLTMCRHFQRPAYQSGSFWQFSVHMGLSTLSLAHPTSRTYRPLAARKLTRRQFFLVAPLRRTFAQQLPGRCASGLLASQVRRRRWKRGLLVSEPI